MTSVLDDYLERLRRELQASPEEEAEILREVRSHLELALLDLEGTGIDETARVSQAMSRFGSAERIGEELRRVHGRATWQEAGMAALPLLLFALLAGWPGASPWIIPALLGTATALAWRSQRLRGRWPSWWWAWLGWLPFVVPSQPGDLLWGAAAYVLILALVSRRNWLEATLSIYPLATAWAFQQVVLVSGDVRAASWGVAGLRALTLGMAVVWAVLLVRTLRTPSGRGRILRALQGQAAILLLNGGVVVAARLWPSHPYPYPFTLGYFLSVTLPYAAYHSLPFLLFLLLTSLPAILSLAQARARRHPPPSRPAVGG